MTDFSEAREFLARVVPWSPETWVNVHYMYQREGYDRPAVGGRAVKSMDNAVNAIGWALKQDATRGIYACMSSQRRAEEKSGKGGYKFYTAIRHRDDAVTLKSLFLDIDAKDHGDTRACIAHLTKFIADAALPKPSMIVSTGGGLHVYWVLVDPMPVHEWQPLAMALAEATRRHGFKCDTQCTIDAARILRVPDTTNTKYDPPRPVRIVARLEYDYPVDALRKALEPYKDGIAARALQGVHAAVLPPRAPLDGPDDLSAGITRQDMPPVSIVVVAQECPFVFQALTDGGKDLSNPLWNITTLLATFCEKGRAAAHLMAKGHPGYSQTTTDELFDRKTRERTERGIGWPQCATIQGSGATQCGACRHRAVNKSPLNFGQAVQQLLTKPPGATAIPAGGQATGLIPLPPRYSISAAGMITRNVIDAAGNIESIEVLPYPLFNPWVQENPWVLNFETAVYKGSVQRVHLTFEAVATRDAFAKLLSKQGMLLAENQRKLFMEFIMAWMQQLQQTKDAVVQSVPFGWVVGLNGKVDGFTFGGRVWSPTGDKPAAVPDPIIGRQYAPRGELKPWVEACKLITNQRRPALDAIVASAFAAPLVRCTGQAGLLLSAYSLESGIGKSTALKVAQAVWGDPARAIQMLDDTINSVVKKIGELKVLPLYWDELKTDEDTRKFVNLAFRMSLGKEKSRLNSDVSQRDTGTWQTMLISTSNDSIVDHVVRQTKTTTAGLYRMFEYEVPRGEQGQIQTGTATRLVAALNDNFGVAGLEYAKFLGQNFERVDSEVEAYLNALNDEVGAVTDERFWIALLACLMKGAEYANEMGMTEIDLDELKAFLLTVLGKMRDERKHQTIDMKNGLNLSEILSRFLTDMRAKHTLITNRIIVGAGLPPKGSVTVISDASRLDGLYVHYGKDNKLLRIDSSFFSEWCKDRGYSRHVIVKALKDQFGVKYVHGRLGGGTEYARLTEQLLEVDLAGSNITQYVEQTP